MHLVRHDLGAITPNNDLTFLAITGWDTSFSSAAKSPPPRAVEKGVTVPEGLRRERPDRAAGQALAGAPRLDYQ